MEQRVTRLEEWRTGVEARIHDLAHAVWGNGKRGLVEENRQQGEHGRKTREMVESLIAKQQKIEDRAERDEMARQQEMRRFLWGVTLLIVATAVNIVVNLFK